MNQIKLDLWIVSALIVFFSYTFFMMGQGYELERSKEALEKEIRQQRIEMLTTELLNGGGLSE